MHYSKIEPLRDKSQIRRKLNINEEFIVISAFGHIHETKRIIPILKSFNNLSKKHDNILLFLVGEPSISIKDEMDQLIKSNRLEGRVIITGYTDLGMFEEYIDATDICLNLRYPYNGETSGSLMRILSKGKCALVNNLGSFSEIPDDCCVKLESPEYLTDLDEVNMITSKLDELISNPQLIYLIGCKARGFAEINLNIHNIGKQYTTIIKKPSVSIIDESLLIGVIESIKRNFNDSSNSIKDYILRLSETLAYAKS